MLLQALQKNLGTLLELPFYNICSKQTNAFVAIWFWKLAWRKLQFLSTSKLSNTLA